MLFRLHKQKIHQRISLVISLIFLGVGWTLLWMGTFNKVWIKDSSTGPYKLVYQDVTGPYQNVQQPMDEVYYYLLENEIETSRGAGIYLDQPQEVPAEKLRSKVGTLIEAKDFDKLQELDLPYQVIDISKASRIKSDFVYRNPFSFIIAVMRVYPTLRNYFHDHQLVGGPVMQIYDMTNSKIEFVVLDPKEI